MSTPALVRVERDFAAPCERLFKAWLEPEEARHFLFATADGEIVRCEIDARVGGSFLITDHRGGKDADHHGKFLEINPPRRIAFLFRGPGTSDGDWSKVTLDFAPVSAGCRLTLTHEIPPQWAAYADPVRRGWAMILDSFARHMESANG
jgi:uncharacterized protein YndB with AHSA1/START domain